MVNPRVRIGVRVRIRVRVTVRGRGRGRVWLRVSCGEGGDAFSKTSLEYAATH